MQHCNLRIIHQIRIRITLLNPCRTFFSYGAAVKKRENIQFIILDRSFANLTILDSQYETLQNHLTVTQNKFTLGNKESHDGKLFGFKRKPINKKMDS